MNSYIIKYKTIKLKIQIDDTKNFYDAFARKACELKYKVPQRCEVYFACIDKDIQEEYMVNEKDLPPSGLVNIYDMQTLGDKQLSPSPHNE